MAITTIPMITYPGSMPCQATPGSTNSVLNAVNDKMAFVFQCPKAGTLDKAVFEVANVANQPDNGIRVSFQDVDPSTGHPDGVQDQYRDITGVIATGWQVPGLMTSDGTDTGTKRTVTRGQLIAVVIEFVSFVASDSIAIGWYGFGTHIGFRSPPYISNAQTGTYAKDAQGMPMVGLLYSDGTYAVTPNGPHPGIPTQISYNSGTALADEYALRFKVPFKCRMRGVYHVTDADNNPDLVLYDASSSVIDTMSFVSAIRSSGFGGHYTHLWPNGPHTLDANTVYRISLKPGASNVVHWSWLVPSSGWLAAMPGGVEWYLSRRVNAGSWTDVQTQVPWASLILDGIEFTSAGGSGGSHPFIL